MAARMDVNKMMQQHMHERRLLAGSCRRQRAAAGGSFADMNSP